MSEKLKKAEQEALEAIQKLRERCDDPGEKKAGDSQILRAIVDDADEQIKKYGDFDENIPEGMKKKNGTQVIKRA